VREYPNEHQVLAEFKAWVQTKPQEEKQDYFDHENCAFAQFLKEHEYAASPYVGGITWRNSEHAQVPESLIPEELVDILYFHTFGELSTELNG
jgi:hypothetical protein